MKHKSHDKVWIELDNSPLRLLSRDGQYYYLKFTFIGLKDLGL
jgi:hypothetical protein